MTKVAWKGKKEKEIKKGNIKGRRKGTGGVREGKGGCARPETSGPARKKKIYKKERKM